MKQVSHILSYPLSIVFYLFFGLTLVVFHPIQWVCLNTFGYQAHKKSVDFLNFFILVCLRVLGTTFIIKKPRDIPKDVPLIIVANHQSLWDIPPLIWYLHRFHPKFISKKELGKGLPSISFNLRHGGSVLIDRKDPKQATLQIKKITQYITSTNRSVVIFPEGTRSRTGIPKEFKKKGLITLFTDAPEAYVLPITVNNSWKLQRYGMFPIPLGVRLIFKLHPVLKISEYPTKELIDMVERQIVESVTNN